MKTLRSIGTNALLASMAAFGALAFVAPGCGSSDSSVFPPSNDSGPDALSNDSDGSFNFDATIDPDAFWANDPPQKYCGPDGGDAGFATVPDGSPDCPSDKNKEGSPCTTAGETAACWPGLRKNRDVGICKDGKTTCSQHGEALLTWGPCVGAVLPDPNGTTPAQHCSCFSQGQWHIENLVPYFITYSGSGTTYAISTYQDPSTGATTFPTFPPNPPPPVPTKDWSKDDLTVDCSGTFTLCYELKAGDFNNPMPADCSVEKVCLPKTYYGTPNLDQTFPPLPGWLGDASKSACADAFHNNGGYGEMSVLGETNACDQIDDGSGNALVFHRIQYCKAKCSDPAHKGDPDCVSCGQDGSGTFK
jgi:hypothetical protein